MTLLRETTSYRRKLDTLLARIQVAVGKCKDAPKLEGPSQAPLGTGILGGQVRNG